MRDRSHVRLAKMDAALSIIAAEIEGPHGTFDHPFIYYLHQLKYNIRLGNLHKINDRSTAVAVKRTIFHRHIKTPVYSTGSHLLDLVPGHFPLPSVYCLAWICLDVLFCTASIMHLCTISVDRYLSLRYPMKFGRNKSRRRVTLKIVFVWLLSIAMSLPLSLMYSKVGGSRTCLE